MSLDEVRQSYDRVAVDYARQLEGALASDPHDRAALALFADLVGTGGRVLDAGCGTGRVTRHLTDLGLDACGVDLSPGMIGVARRTYPDLTFDVGDMGDLTVPASPFDGVVAWYSIIHTPPARQPEVLSGLARTLRPGGWMALAYKVGDRTVRLESAYGHDGLGYDVFWMRPDEVEARLHAAGLRVTSTTVRRPGSHEKQPQAYVIAQRSTS